MPTDEFERYMSGAATPHDPARILTCEGLRLMQQNVTALAELRARHERLMAESLQLQQEMVDFCDGFRDAVRDVVSRTPLDVSRTQRRAACIDDEPTDAPLLPPPLVPQQVTAGGGANRRSVSDVLSQCTATIVCMNSSSDVIATRPELVHPINRDEFAMISEDDETCHSKSFPEQIVSPSQVGHSTNNQLVSDATLQSSNLLDGTISHDEKVRNAAGSDRGYSDVAAPFVDVPPPMMDGGALQESGLDGLVTRGLDDVVQLEVAADSASFDDPFMALGKSTGSLTSLITDFDSTAASFEIDSATTEDPNASSTSLPVATSHPGAVSDANITL